MLKSQKTLRLSPSSVLWIELRATAALVSFSSHMDRAWGTICPLLFASVGPNSSIIFLTYYFLVMLELYGYKKKKMQPNRISDEIRMKGAAFFPEKNLLSFLVCGDHEMDDRAFFAGQQGGANYRDNLRLLLWPCYFEQQEWHATTKAAMVQPYYRSCLSLLTPE